MNNKSPRFYYKGNQLKQLRAFCAVAKSGKMTDAAEELFLSQPAISLQIRALERELDTVLFERHGPRINLTREGLELYEMARPLVEGLETLNARFNRQMKGDLDSGEVVFAAGESTIIYLLPRLVKLFRERYPNIHVQLRNVTGRDGLAMIRDDEVDFAIGSMLDVPSDISYQPVYSFEPALILPLGHDLAKRKRVRIEDIQKVVARQFNVARNDLLSNRRTRQIVRPRQIAMYLSKTMTPRSLPEIGRRFGGRDHTTVLHAVRKVEELISKDHKLAQEVELLKRLILD